MNSDWQAEDARVNERVEREATGTSVEARQFWVHKQEGRILARMLDRTWRAAIVLEGCRKALARINKVFFSREEQPTGLPALLEKFRRAKALKEVVFGQLVAGANVAFAYVRMHRSHVPLDGILGGLPRDSDYAESYAAARRAMEQVMRRTEELVGPLDEPKEEAAD